MLKVLKCLLVKVLSCFIRRRVYNYNLSIRCIFLNANEIHDFETNLIRRLAGLLYVSDVECGNAKIRAGKKV